LSGNLIVQLGVATEELNRCWYERNTGRRVTDVQRKVKHSAIPWMAATLDGIVEGTEAVFEAKFMLPWSFSEEAASEKYMPQVQHNMWVTHLRTAVLSIITGGGKWVEITIPMDPLYLSVLVSAEKKFWRCVQSGGNTSPDQCRAATAAHRGDPHRRYERLELLGGVRGALPQHPECLSRAQRAKSELKALMPEDAKEAIGHGVKAKRSKSGAVSFDVMETEARRWPRPWPRPRPNSSIRKSRSRLRSAPGDPERASAASGTRRSRVDSILYARRWGNTKSPPFRPLRSTRPPAWSI
jgi:YqaJ-like viral recombinase domain